MRRACVVPLVAVLLSWGHEGAAASWAEVGDAGDLPPSAQVPEGEGRLEEITGSFGLVSECGATIGQPSPCDVDVYRIHVGGAGAFSAHAYGTAVCCADPILYLFDADGRGVLANDDCGGECDPASFPTGTARIPAAAGGALPSGEYFLAVSAGCIGEPSIRPFGAAGPLFPEVCNSVGVFEPTGPGGAGPLLSWDYGGGWVGSPEFLGAYRVLLTGATIPEPGGRALGLAAGVALGLLGALQKRVSIPTVGRTSASGARAVPSRS